jgi:hypothetical protein
VALEGPGVAIAGDAAGDAADGEGAGLAGAVIGLAFEGDGDVGPGPHADTTIETSATPVTDQVAARPRVGDIPGC